MLLSSRFGNPHVSSVLSSNLGQSKVLKHILDLNLGITHTEGIEFTFVANVKHGHWLFQPGPLSLQVVVDKPKSLQVPQNKVVSIF